MRLSGNSVLRKCGLGEGSHTTRAGALVYRVFLEQSDRSPIPNWPKVEGTRPRCVLSASEFPDTLTALHRPVSSPAVSVTGTTSSGKAVRCLAVLIPAPPAPRPRPSSETHVPVR